MAKIIIATSAIEENQIIPLEQRFNPVLVERVEAAKKVYAEPMPCDAYELMHTPCLTPHSSIQCAIAEYDGEQDEEEDFLSEYLGYEVVEFDDTQAYPIINRHSFTVDEYDYPNEFYQTGETYYREELVLCPKFPQDSDSECR